MKFVVGIFVFFSLSFGYAGGISSSGDPEQKPTVTGYIESIGEIIRMGPRSRIVLSIVDTTYQDREAELILRQEIVGVKTVSNSLFFTLDLGEPLLPSRQYSLAVHFDIDGDGKISIGDFINTESYPIIFNQIMTAVNVRKVK